jgi:hypothetical protein
MHFLLLPFLVLFSLINLSDGIPTPPPTLLSTYPQLGSPAATTRYYREPKTRGIDIDPSIQTTRPDFEAHIAQLMPIDRPTPVAGYVEVVTVSNHEYFIIQHGPTKFSDWLPMAGVYRVTPEMVESAMAIGPTQMLFSSQVGVVRGCYEYDSAGRLTRRTAWTWPLDQQTERDIYIRHLSALWTMSIANRLLRPPLRACATVPQQPAAEDLYDYWPDTGKLRSITSHSHWGGLKTYVRHFDESSNELKEPK